MQPDWGLVYDHLTSQVGVNSRKKLQCAITKYYKQKTLEMQQRMKLRREEEDRREREQRSWGHGS